MRVRGEDVASSVRDWLKEDIRKGPSLKHELGKFFAGVSTGSLTLFATLLKFAVKDPSLDRLTVGCFAAFLASTVLALYMAIPYVVRIREGLELYDEYNRIIRSIIRSIIALMGTWFGLWVVGFALGIAKLFSV